MKTHQTRFLGGIKDGIVLFCNKISNLLRGFYISPEQDKSQWLDALIEGALLKGQDFSGTPENCRTDSHALNLTGFTVWSKTKKAGIPACCWMVTGISG